MIETLLIVTVLLLVLVLVFVILIFLRKSTAGPDAPAGPDRTPELLGQLTAIEKLTTSHLGQLKSDLVSQRDELGNALGRGQQAQSDTLAKLRDVLESRLTSFADALTKAAADQRAEQATATQALAKSLQDSSAALAETLGRQQQLVQQALNDQRKSMTELQQALGESVRALGEGLSKSAVDSRAEQANGTQALAKSLQDGSTALAETLGKQQQLVQQSLTDQRKSLTDLQQSLGESVRVMGEGLGKSAAENRVEDRKSAEALSGQVRDKLGEMVLRIDNLAESLKVDAQANRKTLETKMGELQLSNEKRLEEMRQTVDEKLHATLEARLGESFKQVSERLEAVQKGLGEMKVLADGVGDLKKVMTNVKTRGTWGEVQLRALIEDILRPEEFTANWAPRGRGERVEFAIRLPGNEPGVDVYLPIDSKFPVEDYQRLVDAQDVADLEGVRTHGKALEDRIKACAKDIATKYLEPGVTTEFGLLFLPFEGLYAEVLRRPGLVEAVQRDYHIAVCGPTTLGALLNSLRMGFRAVAIQKRSGDIGALLGAVKREFGTFGDVINAVGKRLKQAQDEIENVGVRTRAINRKLKDVEVLPEVEAHSLLPNVVDSEDDDGGA